MSHIVTVDTQVLRAAGEGATFAAAGGQVSGCAMGREVQLGWVDLVRG